MVEHSLGTLIVDDDEGSVHFLKTIFKELQLNEVRYVDNLQDARQILKENELPRLVILSLGLKDGDGMELLEEMKLNDANSRFKETKVIMFSAYIDPKKIKKCMDLGAKIYITKPTEHHTLLKTIEDIIKT